MASASCLRAERILRSAIPRYSSYPAFVGRVSKKIEGDRRCFSVGKGPTDGGKNKNNRIKNKGSKKDNSNNDNASSSPPSSYKKLNEVPLRFPPPPVWGNQIHHFKSQRRARFGPKSQKHLQAATSPQRKYGIAAVRNLNLKLLKDSSNVPILIPGRILKENEKSGGFEGRETTSKTIHNTNKTVGRSINNSDQQTNDPDNGGKPPPRRRRRKLPMVDASALLDKHAYCKRSAFPGGTATKSGHEAAKRLLRGKKDLVDMIRGTIVYQQSQRPFCLTGHGIPPQLLQDHINMADSILKNFNEPAECQLISNLDDSNGNTDPSCPDSMTIRNQDGQTRIWPWPPQKLLQRSYSFTKDRRHHDDDDDALKDISRGWDESLVLYLAVMDRLSKELGPSAVGSYLNKESKKNWNVKMYRGMAYPIELISRPDDEEDGRPVPILEWSPVSSSSSSSSSSNNNKRRKHPHVSIRLQGTPDSNEGSESDGNELIRNPVTLVYDAVFQEDPRLEPVRAAPP